MNALLWLLVLLPLGGGALLAAIGRLARRVTVPVALSIAVAVLGIAVATATGRPSVSAPFLLGLPIGLRVDGLSALFAVTVAAITLAVLGYSAGEFARDPARPRFFGLMLVFAGAMLLTVTATDLLALLVGWELMSVMSYALIGYRWRDPDRTGAATIALLTTRLADVGLYLAAGAALAGAGTLRLAALTGVPGGWRGLVTAGVIAAALGKSAQLPFSFWLSRAMAGPSPVSALLHSATMVAAGGYLLLRSQPLLAASGWGAPTVAWAGGLTALALGAVAVAQTDLKQLLAASTCAQIGFVVLAAGTGGVAAGGVAFVAHAATKSLLFLAAGAWLTALGTKDLGALRGAARRYPLVGLGFAAGALTLAGVPPLSLWIGKDEVLAATLDRSPALYVVGIAAGVLSAAYAVKALVVVLRPLPDDATAGYDTEEPGTRTVTGWQRGPMLVLAVAAVGLGVPALAGNAVPAGWELGTSAVLAIGTAVLVAARPGVLAHLPGVLHRWLDLERAARYLVARPTMRLAHALAAFDDRVLDREVVDTGVGRGVARLGRLARRPQTGLLHQYYAQAAIALILLAIVFVLVR